MNLRISLSLVGLLAVACGSGAPAGDTREAPGPCGTASPDARVCEPNEFCLAGVCEPWVEQTLVEGFDCRPTLGPDEVVFVAEGELRAVPKSGGLARSIGPAVDGRCTTLRVDGDLVLSRYHSERDWFGSLHAYRLSGSDPLRLTADERYVADAVSLGDRVLVAVRPGEIFSVDPLDPEATRTVLFRDRVVFDFARVENELFSIGGETWDREAAVARMSPDGTWEPLLLVASERASLRANGRGDLVLVEDHCGLSSLPVLRFRNLPAGAESFGPAIEITCPQSLAALDDDHAYLRAGLDDPDQRFLRHPLAGGEPNRVRGSDTLWSVVGVDETWLYGTRDGAIVRIPK